MVHDYVREALPLLDPAKIEQTYVLIGGQVASAALALIPMFCGGLDGITVGEPIAQSIHERFGHSVTSAELILPHSQISVWVTNLWFMGG